MKPCRSSYARFAAASSAAISVAAPAAPRCSSRDHRAVAALSSGAGAEAPIFACAANASR
jgi:hypothetical protein